MLLIVVVLFVSTLWWTTNSEIRNAEQNGGSFIANRLLIAVYDGAGRRGINVIFFSVFVLMVLFVVASAISGYNQVKAIRDSLDRTMDSTDNHGS